MSQLTQNFFDRDAQHVARDLLGKVIFVKHHKLWLCAKIIETEAYYLSEKASHASLGFTPKRRALFMPAGTIYMYYARGGDSLNVSVRGNGDAVLIKAGVPYAKAKNAEEMIATMQRLNPVKGSGKIRAIERLCSGQTILCSSLQLKVPTWDQQQFDKNKFYIKDVGYRPQQIIQAKRLGIPAGRDEDLPYRFYDKAYGRSLTKAVREGK